MGGVKLLDFFKKGFTFETLVFGGKEMAFVNLALFDDRTAISYLSVLPGDFFLGAYPLPCFIKENTSGGYLYIRLREQLSFAENQVDVVVGLSFVVVECRHTFHAVPLAKQVCEVFQHLIGVKFGVEFRQGDDKLPCFDTLSCGAASLKFLLTFPCKIAPKGAVCGAVGGIQVLLFCLACDIRNASFDIWQLRHLNEAVSCHSVLSPVLGRSHFATDWSVAAVPMAFDRGTATENCDAIFFVS